MEARPSPGDDEGPRSGGVGGARSVHSSSFAVAANQAGEVPTLPPVGACDAAGEVFQTRPETRNSRRDRTRLRSKEGRRPVHEVSERLLKALDECERVAEAATPDA